jgi:hypothetical protein
MRTTIRINRRIGNPFIFGTKICGIELSLVTSGFNEPIGYLITIKSFMILTDTGDFENIFS